MLRTAFPHAAEAEGSVLGRSPAPCSGSSLSDGRSRLPRARRGGRGGGGEGHDSRARCAVGAGGAQAAGGADLCAGVSASSVPRPRAFLPAAGPAAAPGVGQTAAAASPRARTLGAAFPRGRGTRCKQRTLPRPPARSRGGRCRTPRASAAPGAGGTCHLQRPGGVQGAEGVPGAQAGPLHHVVVRPAEEAVLPQREFIAGDELAAAGHAAETLDVVHLGAGAHHEVILAEADAALGALDAV